MKINNEAEIKASSVKYSLKTCWAKSNETGTGSDGTLPARNWLDGEYAVKNGNNYEWKDGKETSIKYPTFQGITYVMNYIDTNDAFNISRVLTENGNIYGLNGNNADSHLMKNSEWGAIAYLSQSKYGLNGINIWKNNANLNNSTTSPTIYAVTGCCAKTENASAIETTIEEINARTAEVYIWKQKEGQKSSSTGTIYGIYDLSGGTWERTSGYVANGSTNLKGFGSSLTYSGDTLKTVSTKYTTVYWHDSSVDYVGSTSQQNTVMEANYAKNTTIYGDAIGEISTAGKGTTSWHNNHSYFWGLNYPFSKRGGNLWETTGTGVVAFGDADGNSNFSNSFRPVLVRK